MPPAPDRRGRITLAVVLGVTFLVALFIVLFAALIIFASQLMPLVGRVQLADLSVGQCFNGGRAAGSSTEVVFAVEVVDCSEPHTSELVGTFDYPPTDDYPGEAAVSRYADEECARHFRSYVGISYELSALEMTTIFPLAFNWYTGDESIQCVVHPPAGQATSTGSYRNYSR